MSTYPLIFSTTKIVYSLRKERKGQRETIKEKKVIIILLYREGCQSKALQVHRRKCLMNKNHKIFIHPCVSFCVAQNVVYTLPCFFMMITNYAVIIQVSL